MHLKQRDGSCIYGDQRVLPGVVRHVGSIHDHAVRDDVRYRRHADATAYDNYQVYKLFVVHVQIDLSVYTATFL